MKHIAINDAFHRLIDGGLSIEAAWRKLTDSDLQMWCDGNLIARDYVVNCLRITVRDGNIIVMPAGPLGWKKPPSKYTFTIDGAEFERLLFPPDRQDLKNLILREAQRRERGNLQVNAGILHRWIDNSRKDKRSLPTPRSVRMWLAIWRREGKLAIEPAKLKRK